MYFGLQGGKKQEIKNINYEVIKCSNTDTTDATSHKHNLGYEEWTNLRDYEFIH